MKRIIIFLLLLLLTGCYDHRELNTIAILTAVEVNKVDDNFLVEVQIVNPQAPDKTANSQAPYIIYEGNGKTLQDAFRQIKLQLARYIHASHLEIVIINEDIAKEDISEIIDFFIRKPATRAEFYVLIGQSKDVLKVTTPIDEISATSIKNSLEASSNYLGVTNLVTFNEFINMMVNPNIEIIVPSIRIIGNEKEGSNIENTESTVVDAIYKLENLAIFKNNKLLGYLSEEESFIYNLVRNNINNYIINYECDKNKYLALEVITGNSKIIANDGKIKIQVDLSTVINETGCMLDINKEKKMKELEKDINIYLSNMIKKNINNIRDKYNSDVFGFLDYIYKHDYDNYLLVYDNWYNGLFKNYDIRVNSNIKINSKGNIIK